MGDLLKPDFGVTLLTICNFLLLVYLLKKLVWQRVIGAVEKREKQIAADKKEAQDARVAAEQLQAQWTEKLNRVAQEASDKIAEAVKTGEKQREQLLQAAKEQTERMLEQARAQIEADKQQALSEVRGEIVRTALLAARQVVQEDVNTDQARAAVARVLDEIKTK